MKNLMKDKACILVCSLYLIYIVIHGACLIFSGDDIFGWYGSQSLMEYFREKAVNGRYFTNTVTYLIIHHPFLRVVVYTAVHFLLFSQLAKLSRRGNRHRWLSYAFAAVAMFSMNLYVFRQTTSWISGFTNYYFAALFTLMYLNLCMATLSAPEKKAPWFTVCYAALIGFFGSLCLETATILNLFLVCVFLAESLLRRKKLPLAHLVYLVTAAAGACCMFLNQNYSRFAAGEEDEFGSRFIDFSFWDMLTTIYRNFVQFYISTYAFLNLVLAVSVGVLYYKAYFAQEKRPPKYGKAAILLVTGYAAWCFFAQHLGAFSVVSVQYRMQSIEAALMFLFGISLLYLVWHLTKRAVFHRFTLCCVTSVISVLPFLVVDPVTPRCFFCGYIFWAAAAGVLCMETWHRCHLKGRVISVLKLCSVMSVGVYAVIYCYMLILNKYCETLRIRYIKEQLANNANIIQVIELPYPNIQKDYLQQFLTEGAYGEEDIWHYDLIIQDYYGFSQVINKDTPHQFVSMYSHSMTSE